MFWKQEDAELSELLYISLHRQKTPSINNPGPVPSSGSAPKVNVVYSEAEFEGNPLSIVFFFLVQSC